MLIESIIAYSKLHYHMKENPKVKEDHHERTYA